MDTGCRGDSTVQTKRYKMPEKITQTSRVALPNKYYWYYQVEEGDMGQAHSTHGTEEQHIHGFGENIYA